MNSPPNSSPLRVLVTGATGFVGRMLLATAPPLRLRAALRSRPTADLSADHAVVGDIDGQTDWSRSLIGIDCVVHLAARVHVLNPTAHDRVEFERTNVLGTERLARAAAAAGVKRFVFLSSIKVNGETSGHGAFRADDSPQPQDDYARSKMEAERRLSAIETSSGMSVSVVRSPLVYGPGVRANFFRLLSLAHSGLPIPLASVSNARSMVSVWNLCDLIWTLLGSGRSTSGVFMAADGEDVSTPELIRRLAQLMRRPARLFAVPAGALRALAVITGRSAELNRLLGSLRVDISATRSGLGWSPPVTLQTGLQRTVDWYMQQLSARKAA